MKNASWIFTDHIDAVMEDYAGANRAEALAALVRSGLSHNEAEATLCKLDDDLREIQPAEPINYFALA